MKYTNKIVTIIIRSLLGLMFLASGVMGLIGGTSAEGTPESMVPIMKVLGETGIFHMIKVTEVVGGAMLLFGFLPALALLFIAPISVGIIVFELYVAPEFILMGLIIGALTAYLGYAYWDKYKALFQRN